ncbi:MAG: cytochrome P450 [Actinobacteria bacterium]|nr:cytochrome P450 [Actinomycetota bacterium]
MWPPTRIPGQVRGRSPAPRGWRLPARAATGPHRGTVSAGKPPLGVWSGRSADTLSCRETSEIAPTRRPSTASIGRRRAHRPYEVACKTPVLYSPYLLGRDPATWPKPLSFRPERCLDEYFAAAEDTEH